MSRPLLDRFLAVAQAHSDRECLIQGDRRSTYGEVAAHVRGAAERLGRCIAPGDRVALLIENSLEYVAAYYGTWLAGGVAVGLNTALKAEDLARLVSDCGATALLADRSQRELPAVRDRLGSGVEIVEVRHGDGFPAGAPASSDPPPAREDALAAVMYTSGTTGHPKGVMLSHGNLAANTDSIREYLGIVPDDRALCVLPFYYSYGASVLHTHVTTGAAVVVENSFVYPHVVMDRIRAEKVTSFAGVPSTYSLLLRRTDLASFDLSSLRYVTQAGGRMEDAKIQEVRTKVPGARFVVMYGQTEATARLAWVPPEALTRKAGSAGRAIPGVELRIKDDSGRDLGSGELGEVCARGANVMLGYWGDPAETAKVLRDGWLHTGDLGTMDEEGFLFLSGRSREMIKSGAHRIAPDEIEEVIRAVPRVEEVAVTGVDDDVLGQAVKAVVVARDPDDGLRQTILRTCRERLALFKVPKVVEFRTELPRTGTGKIRRHLL